MVAYARIQPRRDTAADWTSADPILAVGELGYETDTGKTKRGDGSTAWSGLAYSLTEVDAAAAIDSHLGGDATDLIATVTAQGSQSNDALTKAQAASTGVRSGQIAVPSSGSGTGEIGTQRRPLALPGPYDAFPGACLLADGRLVMVFREAPTHSTVGGNGVVAVTYSSDSGRTWTAATTLLSIAGFDVRDPSIAASADGTLLWLTYFKATTSVATTGAFVRSSSDGGSTWSAEVRIDPGHTAAAISAPVVELANGNLLATWYGKAGTETVDSSWIAISADRGATWGTVTRVANGPTGARDYQEPVAVRQGGSTSTTVKILCRWGNHDSIAVLTSTNNGVTWGAPVKAFTGWGRPSSVWLTTGLLACVYRDSTTNAAAARFSGDGGATWGPQKVVDAATTQMLYAALVEVARGQAFCGLALEASSTSASIVARYLTDGAAVTPVGDGIPSRRIAVAARGGDGLLAWDDFDRPDSTTLGTAPSGQAWVGGGAIGIDTGTARPTTTGVQVAWLDCGAADVDVEADLLWASNPGIGLMFRVVDASNFLLLTSETAGGANLRLYKLVAGTATQLATAAASTLVTVDGQYHRFRAICRGAKIMCFLDDVVAFSYTLAAGAEQTSFLSPTKAGLRLNQNIAGTTHRARRLTVRR